MDWPSLPSLPTYNDFKTGVRQTLEAAESYVTGEAPPAAETPITGSPVNPEAAPENGSGYHNQVNTAVEEAAFEPGGFVMPTRDEPSPRELIQGVQRLRPQTEDQQAVNIYEERRNQYDSTDPRAYVLEAAAGYRDYMPAVAQQALASELESTYTQAVNNDLSGVLDHISGEKFSALSTEQQGRVLDILRAQGTTQSLLPNIQGRGGAGAASGTTSGEAGHYVNSPVASMGQLLAEGKVDDGLLGSLEDLQQADNLDPALQAQKDDLFTSTLQNIAFPERINQHSKGTCAATRVEVVLAMKDPARYTDSVRRLAREDDGRTRIEGATLTRVPGTEAVDDSGRSVASRLMQPALMEYANGQELDYNNQDDRHHVNQTEGQHFRDNRQGLILDETRHLLQGVLGEDGIAAEHAIFGANAEDRAQVVASTEALMDQGQGPLLVDLDWGDNLTGGDGGHALLLSDLDDNHAFFMNPWGELNSMPRNEFDQRLHASVALSDPPSIPPRAQDKSNYVELAPSRYQNAAQRELGEFISHFQERAEQITDPTIKAQVKDFIETIDSLDAAKAFAQPLTGFVNVQEYDDIEIERSELLVAMGQ